MGVYCEKVVTARKAHRCDACTTEIVPGTKYLRITTQYDDGTPCSVPYHQDCRAEEVRANREAGSDMYAEDWCPLHEHVHEGGREMLCDVPFAVYCRFPEDLDLEPTP